MGLRHLRDEDGVQAEHADDEGHQEEEGEGMILFIDAERSGYEPGQVYETMTVGELAETFAAIAREDGEDIKVYLRHDGGYTYGGITDMCFEMEEEEE